MLQPIADVQRADDRREPFPLGLPAGQQHGEVDVLLSGDGRHQVEGLEHEPHVIAPQDGELVIVEGAEVGFADEGLPRGEAVQAGHAVQQRRLAGAGRAHDRGQLAAFDFEVDAAQRVDGGVALAVAAGQLMCFHDRSGRCLIFGGRRHGDRLGHRSPSSVGLQLFTRPA
jgi:hypothetical protein